MKRSNRGNMLLLELLAVLLLFMLASPVLLTLFGAANSRSVRAEVSAQALADAQNVSAVLYTADDAGAALEDAGAQENDGVWIAGREGYRLEIVLTEEKTAAGTLDRAEIRAVSGDETLFALPCARYRAEEAQP